MVKKTSNKYSDKKIIWFNEKMLSFKDNKVLAPIYVRLKPINSCNHKCFFCVYNADYSNMHANMLKKDIISKEKMFEILDDFKDMGVKATTFSGGGESLLHPNIVEFFEKTKENNIDLSIITNAQLLSGDRAKSLYDAKWIRVSVDYYDKKSFCESRSVSENKFDEIINNIANFYENKQHFCDLTMNYIITQLNYKYVYDAVKFYKTLNLDNIRLCPVWTKDYVEYHKDIKESVIKQIKDARNDFQDDKYIVYDSYNITEEVINRKYDKCFVMQTIPAIGADYKVYTCHNKAYDDSGIIGDIKNQSFKQMWFSETTKEFFNSFNANECCKHQCANDSKNIFIHEMINSYGDNFV